jgi:hypothetical protein
VKKAIAIEWDGQVSCPCRGNTVASREEIKPQIGARGEEIKEGTMGRCR